MSQILLKDGGTGQELLKRSSMPPHPLWSAKVMMEEPEVVQRVHEDFLRAGASVLTLNTYSATPERLEREGAAEMYIPLVSRAIDLGNAARDAVGTGAQLAGCLPPLHGSYRPDMQISPAELLPLYQEIVEHQAEACDLFLCETLSSITEIIAATQAAVETGKPTWVAISVADDNSANLRSGEALIDALEAIEGMGQAGVMLNCSKPEAVDANLEALATTGTPFGAYANGFTGIDALTIGGTVDGLNARLDLTPNAYADFALGWVHSGAKFVGGCCEVGPTHITELARQLRIAGHTITRDL
ncbi:MAG: homocysteine S-methyltransferase family protein [Pseudoruegeria sp.]